MGTLDYERSFGVSFMTSDGNNEWKQVSSIELLAISNNKYLNLMKKQLLVTGGAGYIGSPPVK